MRRIRIALVALVLAVVGAAPVLGAVPFERHAVSGEGVSLEVPASWISVGSSLPRSVLDQLARENPKLAPSIAQLSQPNSPMKFLALDPAVRKGFATNVNVVVTPVRSGMSFSLYRAALLAELRSVVTTPIAERAVTVNGARAVRVSYRLRLSLGRKRTVQTLQYAFLRGRRSVVVTYTTLPAFAAAYQRTFARSARSIRF